MKFSLKEITNLLKEEDFVIKGKPDCTISNAATLSEANDSSLIWVKPGKGKLLNAEEIKGSLIVCDEEVYTKLNGNRDNRAFIIVSEPKRIFSKIVNALFVTLPEAGIHPTAFIHLNAAIGTNCYIGPFAYIGQSIIGNNSIIHGHTYIYDKVKVGNNVIIHAGVVIGSDGFGYAKDENGNVEKFPHIGGVIIEDDVEIGSNTCVDRGALGDTIIRKGAKIDNLVHVAHNVMVGENAFLIAHAMIGGSTHIEKGAWIAPSAALLQQLKIGENAIIGVGAVVTKNVPANETWTGSPARPIEEFLTLQKKLKNLP